MGRCVLLTTVFGEMNEWCRDIGGRRRGRVRVEKERTGEERENVCLYGISRRGRKRREEERERERVYTPSCVNGWVFSTILRSRDSSSVVSRQTIISCHTTSPRCLSQESKRSQSEDRSSVHRSSVFNPIGEKKKTNPYTHTHDTGSHSRCYMQK